MFEIRTLAPGEKITEPGFYNIPLEIHHNQPADGVSVTSGILRNMELKSPADVWAFHQLNPDRWEQERTRALITGSAMAAYIEAGEEGLSKLYLRLPESKPRRPTEAQIAAYDEGNPTKAGAESVEFWRKVEDDGREPLTDSEWDAIVTMGKVLAADPAASAALGGHPEVTMAWKDEANDLWCLARPDQTSFSGMLSDYKKVNTQGRAFDARVCDSRITQHGYYAQMAFASEGFHALTGEWPSQIGLVFQWDAAPHHVLLREVSDEAIQYGHFQNQRARRVFRECLDSGYWPGPGEHIGTYQMPIWLKERLNDEMTTTGVAAQ